MQAHGKIVFAESSAACRRSYGRPPALLSQLLSNSKTVVNLTGSKIGHGVAGPIERHTAAREFADTAQDPVGKTTLVRTSPAGDMYVTTRFEAVDPNSTMVRRLFWWQPPP